MRNPSPRPSRCSPGYRSLAPPLSWAPWGGASGTELHFDRIVAGTLTPRAHGWFDRLNQRGSRPRLADSTRRLGVPCLDGHRHLHEHAGEGSAPAELAIRAFRVLAVGRSSDRVHRSRPRGCDPFRLHKSAVVTRGWEWRTLSISPTSTMRSASGYEDRGTPSGSPCRRVTDASKSASCSAVRYRRAHVGVTEAACSMLATRDVDTPTFWVTGVRPMCTSSRRLRNTIPGTRAVDVGSMLAVDAGHPPPTKRGHLWEARNPVADRPSAEQPTRTSDASYSPRSSCVTETNSGPLPGPDPLPLVPGPGAWGHS